MTDFNKAYSPSSVTPFGDGGHSGEDKGMLGRFVFVNKGDTIATKTLADTQATWDDKTKLATNPWHISAPIVYQENLKGESEVYEWASGAKRTIAFSDYGYRVRFDIADATAAAFFTMNNQSFDAYIITQNGFVEGRKDSSGVIFYPKQVKEFVVEGFYDDSDGKVRFVQAVINFSEKEDFETNLAFTKPSAFDPMTLEGVRLVDVSAVATGASYIVTVTVVDQTGAPIVGLVEADFTVTGGTVSVFSETGGGIYSFTMADATVSTYTLVASASISIDDKIKSSGATGNITPAT